jgi:DNA polymerase III subunit delta'
MSETNLPEADREGDLPHPRHVYELFGHDAEERSAADAFATGRMHHAWMLTGPKGSGKATLAWRMARRALGAQASGEGLESDPADPVCKRLEALSHPDFLLLRRPYDDKRNRIKGEITIEESRRAPEFFSKSASGNGWRVCIVDAADEMNVNASNALLKTLEEPPKRGLLILVVHAPGRLPSTIRSRCRRLIVRNPSMDACAQWLRDRHGMAADMAGHAAALAQGAPGRALVLAAMDGPKVKAILDTALSRLPDLDRPGITALASEATKKDAEGLRRTLMEFMSAYAHDRARALAAEPKGLDEAGLWVRAGDEVARLAREGEAIYLDPRQTLYAAFSRLQEAAVAARRNA